MSVTLHRGSSGRARNRAVAVCGAGVGGLTLAARLAGLGFGVTVFESRDEAAIAREGVFLTLAPNGANGLRAIGCYDAVRAAGIDTTAIELTNASGRLLFRVDQSADEVLFGSPSITIRRGQLLTVLVAAACSAGADVRFGARVGSVAHVEDLRGPARVELADGSIHEADVVVAADGLRSVVRREIFREFPLPRFTRRVGTGGITDADVPDTGGTMRMTFGSRAFFGYIKARGGPVFWFDSYEVPGDGEPTGRVDDPAAQARLVRQLHARDAGMAKAILDRVPAIDRIYPLYDMPRLPAWSRGAVVLIGDAAHAVGPDAGQGASMAIEDALVLAACLETASDRAAAFGRFELLRRPRVDRVAKLTARNQSSKAARSWLALKLRDLILPWAIPIGVKRGRELFRFRVDLGPLASGDF